MASTASSRWTQNVNPWECDSPNRVGLLCRGQRRDLGGGPCGSSRRADVRFRPFSIRLLVCLGRRVVLVHVCDRAGRAFLGAEKIKIRKSQAAGVHDAPIGLRTRTPVPLAAESVPINGAVSRTQQHLKTPPIRSENARKHVPRCVVLRVNPPPECSTDQPNVCCLAQPSHRAPYCRADHQQTFPLSPLGMFFWSARRECFFRSVFRPRLCYVDAGDGREGRCPGGVFFLRPPRCRGREMPVPGDVVKGIRSPAGIGFQCREILQP